MKDSQSLVVIKKGIFKKVQDFFRSLFKKEHPTNNVMTPEPLNISKKKENFVNDLKKSSNSDIKELIAQIQNGELILDTKNDEELKKIEEQLLEYLNYLDKEIELKREEISSLERKILTSINY